MDTTAPERPEWNTGGGDHDQLRPTYVIGHTDLYLCAPERARLSLLRAGVRACKFTDDTTPDSQKGDLQI